MPYESLKHIDIINGYTQHMNIEEQYRMGFGYFTDFRYVSDVNFAMDYNGLYICECDFEGSTIKHL